MEDSSILYLVASAAFVSTTFEALPVTDVLDDNIVVPASAVLTMMALGFH